MKKVKTETECKNGSQHSRCIPNAHLTFEYSKAFLTQLFTAKSKYTHKKRNFQSFYIKPRNAMPPVCCWAWTQKALFTIFFCLFPTVLYCNCVLSSNMHLVVLSHRCVQTIWSVRKPPGLTPNRKGQWICPSSGFSGEVCISVRSGSFPASPLPVLYSICFSPQKAATGSAGKWEAAVHCFPDPAPPRGELWHSHHSGLPV